MEGRVPVHRCHHRCKKTVEHQSGAFPARRCSLPYPILLRHRGGGRLDAPTPTDATTILVQLAVPELDESCNSAASEPSSLLYSLSIGIYMMVSDAVQTPTASRQLGYFHHTWPSQLPGHLPWVAVWLFLAKYSH